MFVCTRRRRRRPRVRAAACAFGSVGFEERPTDSSESRSNAMHTFYSTVFCVYLVCARLRCCAVLTQLRGWSHAQTTTQPNPLPTRAHLSAHGPQGPS